MRTGWVAGWSWAVLVLGGATPLLAQQAPPSGTPEVASRYEIRRAEGPVTVDARLDEAAWGAAATVPLPIEIAPNDNAAAVVRTECHFTYDDEALYLGCTAHDPRPEEIRAFLTDRDGIFGNNDRISLLIDPFNDLRRGWVFEVSPLGVQADLVYDERTDDFDATWDAIWESAGRITESGYVVEARIPFRSLRFPDQGAASQTWRFWINRMRPRTDAYRIMRTNTRIRGEACQLCQAPVLVGIRGVSPGSNVEVTPTVVMSRADAPAVGPVGTLDAGPVDAEAGVDLRWSPTTELALNATLNPDFSQVEADVPQLEANTRFALSFPEKRPFFLEGADLFRTPLRAVFTRSVADPLGGAKLTGKLGQQGVGVLFTRDAVNNVIVPGPYTSRTARFDGEVTGAMARYRRDLGGRHTIGGLYTGRVGTGSYINHVAGADAFFQPTSEITANVQLLGSLSQYDDSVAASLDQPTGRFDGLAFAGEVSYDAPNWGVTGLADYRDAGFRADAGFIPQVDFRGAAVIGRRSWFGEAGDAFSLLELRSGIWDNRTTAGGLIQRGIWMRLGYEGPLQSEAWLNPQVREEGFDGLTFDITEVNTGFTFRPVGWLRLGVSGTAGTTVDLRNLRRVDNRRISPSTDWQIGRRGEVGVQTSLQRLSLGGEEVLSAQVGQLRTVYNFSTRSFVRAIVQYRRTERNPATNPGLATTLTEGVFTNLLFSYKLNPLTVLFLGYTDDRAGFEDVASPRVRLTPSGRTFFLKVGYAWRP